jgi:dolichol-phosphate mannosyltransferase
MDADLCHDPQDLPRMLEKIADCDMVIGSRYLASGVKLMQDKSRLAAGLSVISQSLSRLALGYSGTDMSHSFRMFHKSVFNAVKVDLRHEGNTFMVEFYFETARRGFRIAEIPIIYGKRVHGKTKLDIRKEGLRYLRLLGYILLKRIRTRT